MSEQSRSKREKSITGRRLVRFMHRIAYQTWNNPIVLKELRGRMRGWRAATVLIVHLTMLGCFASFIYFVVAESASTSGSTGIGQTMGQTLFYSTYLMLLVLVVFLSPAFTAGAISGERERKTIDLLITTLLPTHSLVLGKLISALAYVVLLILAALPIQSLAFMFGGVVLAEMVIGTILLLVTALIVGSVGILVSSIVKSSIASTVLTYAVILMATLGIPIIIGITLGFLGVLLETILDSLSWLWQGVLLYLGGFLICTNPFATVVTTKLIEDSENTLFFFTTNISGGGISFNAPLISPWIVYTLLYTALSAALILASILVIRWKRG
jgi:ABC-2 type transport system permease protein